MTPPTTPRMHHVALTVSDVDASVSWYETVFPVTHRVDIPHEGGVGKLLSDDRGGLMFVLHEHATNDGVPFAETTTGLDHVGLAVPTRAELQAWQDHLEAQGVTKTAVADKPLTQSPIADAPYASVLVFRDPDNIQLELFAPAATRGALPAPGASGSPGDG
ncbi:MAG TPA: VOC family protein [Acidimicrobiales bacterium]|nr:VOC family protein [Acidimicrobiales bacterium]